MIRPLILLISLVMPATAQNFLLHETFDSTLEGWTVFTGIRGDPPRAAIVPKLGLNDSPALAVTHTEEFRSDKLI